MGMKAVKPMSEQSPEPHCDWPITVAKVLLHSNWFKYGLVRILYMIEYTPTSKNKSEINV